MKKRIFAAAVAVAAGLFALTAFAEEEKLSIGEKKTDYDFEVTLVNETGMEIKEAFLRSNYGDFSENLLADGVVFEKDAQAVLYCTPADMVNYIPSVYDLKLVFEDDSEAVLHTLPFGDANEITIVREKAETAEAESEAEAEAESKDVVYIRFTSLSLNYETDTKRREGEIAQIGEQVLIADYQAKVAGGGYSGGGGGGYSGGGGGGTTQDSCLGDGLMY